MIVNAKAQRTGSPPSPARELVEANARLERRVSELVAIQELALSLTSELRLGAVLEAALTTVASLTGALEVCLLLLERGRLVVRARRGGQAFRTVGQCVALGDGLCGWVAQHQVPLLLPDIEAHPCFTEPGRAEGLEGGSFIGLPLLFRERLVGVLCAAQKAGGLAFDERDLRLLISLAPHLAVAIRNAELFARCESRVGADRSEPLGAEL